MKEGEQVNYASKLLSFPNDHFSVTGLTDAKAGIENGRYAAYMYMDTILAEFHRVQDDSAAILSNDNTELELLESVNAMQLIAAVENVEEMQILQ